MKIPFNLLCCFNSLKAIVIEILIIVLSSIGLIISVIGVIIIPWKYTSNVMESFYIISLIFFVYSLVVSIIIFHLRKKNNLEKSTIVCFFISFFELFICILSILMYIFIAIIVITDLHNKKKIKNIERLDPETGITYISRSDEGKVVSEGELTFAIISIVINIILWIILLFLWISDLIRIKYKINGAFNENLIKVNKSNNNLKNLELNIIGHDKFGFPIYSKKNGGNLEINRSKSNFNYKPKEKDIFKFDNENNNIFKYSYKEKFNENRYRKPKYKSVDLSNNKFK